MPTTEGKMAGADIVISIRVLDTEIVLGKRNIKIKTSTDEIDFTTRPEGGYVTGTPWWKEKGVGFSDWGCDLDGIIQLTGVTAGFARMLEVQSSRIECDVVFDFGGEATGTGKGFLANLTCDGPYDKEATFSGNLFGSSQLVIAAT